MNTEELASQIIDVQPDSLGTEELVSISALPDNLLIRAHYANPQGGCDLLSDYTDSELDGLFSACNSLTEADELVAKLASERPLTKDEADLIRDRVLNVTLRTAIDIADKRQADGYPLSCLKPIVTMVVLSLREFVGKFSINGQQI